MNIKGSKLKIFDGYLGESEARNKYTYFASVAKEYQQIAAIFEETATTKSEHAVLWFKALGQLGDTAANLLSAAQGENKSGQKCTNSLLKKQSKKAYRSCKTVQKVAELKSP